MILSTIKADQLNARRQRDAVKASLLTTVLGEADTIAKNKGMAELPDDEMISILKKFVKNVNLVVTAAGATETTTKELEILNSYLPKMLTDEELVNILKTIKQEIGDSVNEKQIMGEMLKRLKAAYPGLYDGAKAAQLAKTV